MSKGFRPETTTFLSILALTTAVWILRGLSILAFLPGIVLWILILLSLATGIFSILQRR